MSAPSFCWRRSTSWSPLLRSWISTRWSRGFRTCGFVSRSRAAACPGTLRTCFLIFVEVGRRCRSGCSILSPPALNFTSVARASSGHARRVVDGASVVREAERLLEAVLLRLGDGADVLHADEEVVRVVRRRRPARRPASGSPTSCTALRTAAASIVLLERDLDLGAASEVGAVVRARVVRGGRATR